MCPFNLFQMRFSDRMTERACVYLQSCSPTRLRYSATSSRLTEGFYVGGKGWIAAAAGCRSANSVSQSTIYVLLTPVHGSFPPPPPSLFLSLFQAHAVHEHFHSQCFCGGGSSCCCYPLVGATLVPKHDGSAEKGISTHGGREGALHELADC